MMFGRSADAYEYGRKGVMGWAQEHALACALGAALAWVIVVYAVLSSLLSLR